MTTATPASPSSAKAQTMPSHWTEIMKSVCASGSFSTCVIWDRQSHWYALPLAVEPMYPVVCVQTTCVAPAEAAFSRASFLAFCIPVLDAMFPKPDEPSTSDTNLHRVTCESSATWTRCAAGLNVVAHPVTRHASSKDKPLRLASGIRRLGVTGEFSNDVEARTRGK
jgi:hypothetical protein